MFQHFNSAFSSERKTKTSSFIGNQLAGTTTTSFHRQAERVWIPQDKFFAPRAHNMTAGWHVSQPIVRFSFCFTRYRLTNNKSRERAVPGTITNPVYKSSMPRSFFFSPFKRLILGMDKAVHVSCQSSGLLLRPNSLIMHHFSR